jgi:DNA-binding transcriptional ArsR family regulator
MTSEYHSTVCGSNSPLALALEDAACGYAVFPVAGKAPAIKGGRGCKDGTREPQRITALFNAAAHKATGYGIATGATSRLAVVDIDGEQAEAEARRRGLTSDYVVRTGRPEGHGWHLYYSIPEGADVRSRTLAPGLEIKGSGSYVVGAGSFHPSGNRYRLVRNGEPSPAPEWMLGTPEARPEKCTSWGSTRSASEAVSVDVAGPPILQSEPGRNLTLTQICGRLHDGTRDLAQLTRDLQAVNEARCQPQLPGREVEKIAASIFGKEPCSPAPEPTPWVKAAIEYLRSVRRQVKGMGGSTGWAIYNGLLDHASRRGRQHERGVSISIDMRTAARLAGTNSATVSRWIRRTDLVSVLRRGSGRRGSLLLLHVPESEGHRLQHSSTWGGSEVTDRSRSVATSALQRTIYRLRWSGGSAKARHGVTKGTSKVRQGVTPARDGMRRIGKSKAAILSAMVDCSGEISLCALAERLGRSKRSMREPLKWLVDNGLIIRVRRGYYDLPEDFIQRLEDARELGREPEADRLQIADHVRQRAAYRGQESGETKGAEQGGHERRGGDHDDRGQDDDHGDDGRHDRDGGGTAAGRENVARSRAKREAHLRQQRERERQHPGRRPTAEERERRERIDRLVREGMSRRLAEAEVHGVAPFEDVI